MELLPEHRTLLGVDVVASASNPGHHLSALGEAVPDMVHSALTNAGIDRAEITYFEHTGDGLLMALPSKWLGAVVDASVPLDHLATSRNLWHKPEVRMRIAIEVGPVPDDDGFYAPRISHGRLLNADRFKKLFERCLTERTDGSVNTALIVSDDVFRTVFAGNHTKAVRRADFATIKIRNKEFSQSAMVRVPGFDARSIASFLEAGADPERQPTGGQPTPQVSNSVGRDMSGVQAGIIQGGFTIGRKAT